MKSGIVLTFILLFLSTSSCADSDFIMVDIGSTVVTETLLKRLEKEKIPYKPNSDTSIYVDKTDLNRVTIILDSFYEAILPKDRSASFDERTHDEIIKQLKLNDIEYEIILAHNSKWVVWRKGDKEKIDKIIYEIKVRELENQLKGE